MPDASRTHPSDGHLPGSDEHGRGRRLRPRSGTRDGSSNGPDLSPGGSNLSGWKRWLLPVLAVLALGFLFAQIFATPSTNELSYTQFLDRVQASKVAKVTVGPDGRVTGSMKSGERFRTTIPTALDNGDLEQTLRDKGVTIDARAPSDNGLLAIVVNLLPFVLIIGVLWWFSRRARGQVSQLSQAGRSKAKVRDTEFPDTRFDDVAGYDAVKSEIREFVDYLKDPSAYQAVGARGPGGILMIGPPGTGKTLLARAVAGEAGVAFINTAGSEFVEMLVGVGASRVRDLFAKARKRAPAIIFIDELDSIGRKRGGATTIGTNNEQEQTLNQLLAEMDGFDPASGVVVIAATNRADMLDDALTRPGRFDRQVTVPLPRQDERLEILRLHSGGKPVGDDVDLDSVARGTPGFSGADLENLMNEAAINAVRNDRVEILQEDVDHARDRVLLGRRQSSSILRPEERERVAVHEAGHALVAALSDDTDPVSKVTILPTRQALGVTEQLPLDERRLYRESYLHDMLAVRMGGRVAERIVLGQMSSGAAHDLSGATKIATRMVRDFGFSEKVGPVGWGEQGENGSVPPALRSRPYAEETQRQLDEEVRRVLTEAEHRSEQLLHAHRGQLDRLVDELLDRETVDGAWIYDLVDREPPSGERPARDITPHPGS